MKESKEWYDINFQDYSICLFHPVTTEIDVLESQVNCLIESLIESEKNYVVIYPNNDLGSKLIIENYKKIKSPNIKFFSSMRFEFFLTILKNSNFIIGNSSAGIREAPYYSLHSINIGSRQNKRDQNPLINNVDFDKKQILNSIKNLSKVKGQKPIKNYGDGNSSEQFINILQLESFWKIKNQKIFNDIK